ncbi:(2Fe-2S) ferredoxin domain-containing protein [Melittangium boletus]|uniref:(2Fe-2S) ferredoxin domain-containing protein n=1 Tax=Melittangium boletus TaxID=83453 RepID=UPI003DA38AEA
MHIRAMQALGAPLLGRPLGAPVSKGPEPWLQVCHRCLMRLPPRAGGVDLPRRLRETLGPHSPTKSVAVSLTGCMGLCPEGRVSVRWLGGPTASEVGGIDPMKDGVELVAHLRGRAPEEP